MTHTDRLHSYGYISELRQSGQVVTIGNVQCAALTNTEPRYLEMLESGYVNKNPVAVEILKGRNTSTDTAWIGAVAAPQDFRGQNPLLLGKMIIDGVNRKIMKIHDAGDRWVLMTIPSNAQ